jgi:glutaredoxin
MTNATNVIIYSAPWCAFCKTEKQYLEHLGVSEETRVQLRDRLIE